MIAKILQEHERKINEENLQKKVEEIWFYKVNDDNIHPIFKPFHFAEDELIKHFEHDKEKYLLFGNKRMNFGIGFQKHYIETLSESDHQSVVSAKEAKKVKPTDIMKNYIRNKKFDSSQNLFLNYEKELQKFSLFNFCEVFNIKKESSSQSVKNFSAKLKKFTFIIHSDFKEILEKRESFKKIESLSLLDFIKEELETSFNEANLQTYLSKLPNCAEQEFNEDTFCEQIIKIYTLEGELSHIINNFTKGDDRIALFRLLLQYSLDHFEPNSTDITLYRVIKTDLNDNAFRKGDILFNSQYFLTTSDVSESLKYLWEDEEEETHSKQNERNIIFEIFIRKRKQIVSPTICSIREFSYFPFENEYVLTPNNIFRIQDVLPYAKNNKILTVKLCLEPGYYKESTEIGKYLETNTGIKMYKNIILDCERKSQEDNKKLEERIKKLTTLQENLQELRLRNINSVDCNDENLFMSKVQEVLKFAPNINKIDLSVNNLSDESLLKLCEALIDNKKKLNEKVNPTAYVEIPTKAITNIVLSRNNIKDITPLCNMAKSASKINVKNQIVPFERVIEIDLSFNKLTSNSARDLSKIFKFFNLQKIDLSFNRIRFEGAKAIVEKLNETPNLQYLDLSNNNLFSEEHEFETVLGKNLKLVKQLNTLILQNCNLSSESIKLITQSMNENIHLEVINFSCNKIDRYGILFLK